MAALESAVAGSGTIDAENGKTFSFSTPVRKLLVAVKSTASDPLKIRLNSDVCNPSNSQWDYEIVPGGILAYNDRRHRVLTVQAYSEAALVKGDDFSIKGIA
jgi:hypothetical protein